MVPTQLKCNKLNMPLRCRQKAYLVMPGKAEKRADAGPMNQDSRAHAYPMARDPSWVLGELRRQYQPDRDGGN